LVLDATVPAATVVDAGAEQPANATAPTTASSIPLMPRIMPDIALAVRAETGSSLGHLGVGSLAGQVADAAAQYPAARMHLRVGGGSEVPRGSVRVSVLVGSDSKLPADVFGLS
jgi:hypothetical protein